MFLLNMALRILEMKYGILLGRFQPFHIAHEAIVHEIIADGLKPLIIVGSNNVRNKRNPYSALERLEMIQAVFPKVYVNTVGDYDNWDTWFSVLRHNVPELDNSEVVWYINNKESDRQSFTFNGKEYKSEFYTQVLKDLGYKVKEVTYPKLLNLTISSSAIRDNLEVHRHYLDARVYKYLKELQNVKEKVSCNK